MNTGEPNLPLPGIEFVPTVNGCIDAVACLDHLPGGMRLRVHEMLGADEHWVTVERSGLQVKFCLTLFHLDCLIQSLHAFALRVRDERGYPAAQPVQQPTPRVERQESE